MANPDIIVSTLQAVRDQAVDQLYVETPLFFYSKKFGAEVDHIGGRSVVAPIVDTNHATITELDTGWELPNQTYSPTLNSAEFQFAKLVLPVGITEVEKALNRGDLERVDILATRLRDNARQMKVAITERLLGNSASSNGFSLSTIETLNGMSSGDATNGWFEPNAFGSQANSIGGVARGSILGWDHQFADAADDFSANGLSAMHSIEIGRRSYGGTEKCLILASTKAFKNYKNSIQVNERYVDAKALDGGRLDLTYSGLPIAVDIALDVHDAAGTADEEISMIFLDMAHIKLDVQKDYWFDLSDWQKLDGVHGDGCYLRCFFTPTVDHFASSGILVDGNTF